MMDEMVQEWLALLELTTNYMTAAEAVIDALLGKYSAKMTRAEAEAQTRQLVRAYGEAKRAMMEHARSREAMLSA